jgi:hypothetical protein
METQLCIGIGLIVGFVVGLFASLMLKKSSDIISCLADFVIYGKKLGKSDEDVYQSIKNMLDIMLKGYSDFEQDPDVAQQKLRDEQQQTKEMKALIKAYNKLTKKSNQIINNLK